MPTKYDVARHFWDHKGDKGYTLTSREASEIFGIGLTDAQGILSKLRKDKILDIMPEYERSQGRYFLRGWVNEQDIDALKSYTLEQILNGNAQAK